MNAPIRHDGVISCAFLSENCGDNSTLTWLGAKVKSFFRGGKSGKSTLHVFAILGKTWENILSKFFVHHNDNKNERVEFHEHSQFEEDEFDIYNQL